jgi:hypothetical protein
LLSGFELTRAFGWWFSKRVFWFVISKKLVGCSHITCIAHKRPLKALGNTLINGWLLQCNKQVRKKNQRLYLFHTLFLKNMITITKPWWWSVKKLWQLEVFVIEKFTITTTWQIVWWNKQQSITIANPYYKIFRNSCYGENHHHNYVTNCVMKQTTNNHHCKSIL